MSELMPDDYAATLEDLKRQVHASRLRVQRKANTELLRLWWQIGRTILDRQDEQGWGTRVLERLATDLRSEFPSMKGFSRANLFYMRGFAEAWPDADAIVQRPVGQLPWGHVITKDPYALQFLAIDGDASERELEQRMVERILETMRELGPGFAFVGRQVHLQVGQTDFYIDLLFFHIEQLRYVVIELKTTTFTPADAGQLGFYVTVVDDKLRVPEKHQPTVGILLVAGKDDTVVRYALASTTQPVAVSRYELGEEEQKALPDEAAIARAFSDELHRGRDEAEGPAAW